MFRFSYGNTKKTRWRCFENALGAPMIARVEDVGERYLKDFGHLKRVGDERKGGGDDADDRGDFEPGPGHVSVEPPDHGYVIGGQADFFLGLAQRGGDRVVVAGLDAAAGKRDLTGVRAQMGGS